MADVWKRRHGIETSFVATMREGDEAYRRAGHPSTFIADVAFDDVSPVSDATLADIDRTYGPPLLRRIVRSDVHLDLLYGDGSPAALHVVARAIRFWERYLDEQAIDAVFVRETQSFATRSAYVVARRRGIPVLRPDIGPSDDWFTLSDVDEHACSTALLHALQQGPRPLEPAERRLVDELVAARVPAAAPPGRLRDPGVRLALLPLHLGRERVREARARRREDPVAVAGHRLRRRFLRQRSLARRTRSRFPYEAAPAGSYVYFPLPFRDEGMVLANHPYWAGHLHDLVAAVAEALPSGTQLVVKEHPGVPGDQTIAELRAMHRLDRVHIVDPTAPGLDLIRGSDAVLVLGGTAGWEAFLCRRPVVVFAASPYYAHSRLVEKVADVDSLQVALASAIRAGTSRYDESDDEWAWFIHATIDSALPGRFFSFEFPYFTDQNLGRVADGLAGKILAASTTGGAR